MEKDKLEQFITENRQTFEIEGPSDDLWDKIKKPEKPIRKISLPGWALRVAAAMLIFMIAWFGRDWLDKKENEIVVDENTITPEQEKQYRLLMEAEMYYTSRINDARSELAVLAGTDKSILEDLDTDLTELDDIFEDLKNDLKENGDNEEVIEAMIQNYRIKLEILEEMLRQINDSGQRKDKNDPHEI